MFHETVEDDKQDLERYRFTDGSRLNHIFEHYGPDKSFMPNFVKKQLSTILERTKQDANIASLNLCTLSEVYIRLARGYGEETIYKIVKCVVL